MTAFESVFQTERKRLRELWQRWDGVNERIQAMSVDTSTKAPVGNVDVDVDVDAEGKNYAIQYRKLQDEYQRKRDDILQRFEEANQGLVASVQAGEKVSAVPEVSKSRSGEMEKGCCDANAGDRNTSNRARSSDRAFCSLCRRRCWRMRSDTWLGLF